jgi:hypothetical protein
MAWLPPLLTGILDNNNERRREAEQSLLSAIFQDAGGVLRELLRLLLRLDAATADDTLQQVASVMVSIVLRLQGPPADPAALGALQVVFPPALVRTFCGR